MNSPSANLLVCVSEQVACIKVEGRANFTSSVDFKTFVSSLQEKGYSRFVVELSDCALMDSTFLGVLAGLVANVIPANAQEGRFGVRLLNAAPRLVELLENLGVDHLFKFVRGPTPLGATVSAVAEATTSKVELNRTCLEAHELLMALNPENIPKFKDVAQFLAEDLRKSEGAK